MYKFAETLVTDIMIDGIFYMTTQKDTDKEKIIYSKSLVHNLNKLFSYWANSKPNEIINLMDDILEHLENTSIENRNKIQGIYNLQQRLKRLQPQPKITILNFYKHCLETHCDGTPFQHPNGWRLRAKPLDNIHYLGKPIYEEEGKRYCMRFYLGNDVKEYSYDYFINSNSKFWSVSGLAQVDFDDCYFLELEKIIEWLGEHKPECLETH